MDLSDIRKDYKKGEITRMDVEENPFLMFEKWISLAISQNVIEPTAMALSTLSETRRITSRIVLLKSFSENEGFTFFTNYNSVKGQSLLRNPFASLLFFWPQLEKQVRIEGDVEKVDYEVSAQYFDSRPLESRYAAYASPQSQLIKSKKELEERVENVKKEIKPSDLKCPDYWGGFSLKPIYFEFWQGGENRMHDRIAYEFSNNEWLTHRLAP